MENNIDNNSYWDSVRSFSTSRTPFWKSILIEFFITIGPFLAIWLLAGADFQSFSFNYFNTALKHNTGYVAAILVGYLIYGLSLNTFLFFLKAHKADSFTYTLGLILFGSAIILNGTWMYEWTSVNQMFRVFVRFLIGIPFGIIGVIGGVYLTGIFRNINYKIEEDDKKILDAYRAGLPVPTKNQLRIERADKAAKKSEEQRLELEEFKKELDQKLIESFDDKNQTEKIDKIKTKLDAKEQKQRDKKNKNK